MCCELLSNFLYFCSRNNGNNLILPLVVLWIALKFFVLLQSKQLSPMSRKRRICCELLSNFLYFCSRNNSKIWYLTYEKVVNCSQIFCTFAVETTRIVLISNVVGCELLSNFLYFCSRNNCWMVASPELAVVNCSQIFCTFAVETTVLADCYTAWCCELLSNFLYFCSRNNLMRGLV